MGIMLHSIVIGLTLAITDGANFSKISLLLVNDLSYLTIGSHAFDRARISPTL